MPICGCQYANDYAKALQMINSCMKSSTLWRSSKYKNEQLHQTIPHCEEKKHDLYKATCKTHHANKMCTPMECAHLFYKELHFLHIYNADFLLTIAFRDVALHKRYAVFFKHAFPKLTRKKVKGSSSLEGTPK